MEEEIYVVITIPPIVRIGKHDKVEYKGKENNTYEAFKNFDDAFAFKEKEQNQKPYSLVEIEILKLRG